MTTETNETAINRARRVLEAAHKAWLAIADFRRRRRRYIRYTYGDQWVDEQCEYLKGSAEIVRKFVEEKMPKVKVTTHEGTFLMWLDMTCFGKTSDELTEIFAKEYGLAIGNGAHYGKQAEGYMRLNIGCARGILQKGLDQMAKMYADYINK